MPPKKQPPKRQPMSAQEKKRRGIARCGKLDGRIVVDTTELFNSAYKPSVTQISHIFEVKPKKVPKVKIKKDKIKTVINRSEFHVECAPEGEGANFSHRKDEKEADDSEAIRVKEQINVEDDDESLEIVDSRGVRWQGKDGGLEGLEKHPNQLKDAYRTEEPTIIEESDTQEDEESVEESEDSEDSVEIEEVDDGCVTALAKSLGPGVASFRKSIMISIRRSTNPKRLVNCQVFSKDMLDEHNRTIEIKSSPSSSRQSRVSTISDDLFSCTPIRSRRSDNFSDTLLSGFHPSEQFASTPIDTKRSTGVPRLSVAISYQQNLFENESSSSSDKTNESQESDRTEIVTEKTFEEEDEPMPCDEFENMSIIESEIMDTSQTDSITKELSTKSNDSVEEDEQSTPTKTNSIEEQTICNESESTNESTASEKSEDFDRTQLPKEEESLRSSSVSPRSEQTSQGIRTAEMEQESMENNGESNVSDNESEMMINMNDTDLLNEMALNAEDYTVDKKRARRSDEDDMNNKENIMKSRKTVEPQERQLLKENRMSVLAADATKRYSIGSVGNEVSIDMGETLGRSVLSENNCSRAPTGMSIHIDESHKAFYLDPNAGTTTDYEDLLYVVKQQEPCKWGSFPKKTFGETAKKIGEGSYGEVYSTIYKDKPVALKIVLFEPDPTKKKWLGVKTINGFNVSSAAAVLPEVVVIKELAALNKFGYQMSPNFLNIMDIKVVQGKYPKGLQDAWDRYHEEKESLNESPTNYTKLKQCFLAFFFENGGMDLEKYKIENEKQYRSIISQLLLSLAIAEQALEFEHRDMHVGNVLIDNKTKMKQLEYRLDGKPIVVKTHGVKANIIDFTLSRIRKEFTTVYLNLENDPDMFAPGPDGDYTEQGQVYQKMRKNNKRDWQAFNPFTNVLWVNFLGTEMLKEEICPKGVLTSTQKRNFEQTLEHLLSSKSAYQACSDIRILNGFFAGAAEFPQE